MANSEWRTANSGVSAFVLAGGRSSRMGTDKALLTVGEQTLLERALGTASAVAERTYIVGPKQRYAALGSVIEDIHPGCGPLAGIHAALSFTSTEHNLILSVDTPQMSTVFLNWLIQKAKGASEWIVVPDAAGGLQPLCAVYRREVAGLAEEALRMGDYKVGKLFLRAPTRIITEQEIVTNGFSTGIFDNINTPEDYAKCQS